jgi:anti-sigma factor RsiW
MKHISSDEWMRYVKGELTDELRDSYEAHLYDCEECMNSYLKAMEASESSLPLLSEGSQLTDAIMKQIGEVDLTRGATNQRPFYQHTLFHYVIAAAMTLVLMFSGVFHSITTYVDDVQSTTLSQQTSITEKILETKFTKIIDEK